MGMCLVRRSSRRDRRHDFAMCAATFLAAMTVSVPVLATTAWSPEELALMKSGEAVVRVTKAASPADGDVRGAIEIVAPATAVWAVLVDCAGAPSFMENLKSCSIIEQGPDGAWDVRQHVVQWTMFLPELRSVFRSDYIKDKSIHFALAGGDLSYLEGSWVLEPLVGGAKTRVHYEARVGFSALVPGLLVRNALMKDIPNFLTILREEVLRRHAMAGAN